MGPAPKLVLTLLVGLASSLSAEKKTTSTSATPSTGSYVPLNSMTISSLFRDGASSSSSSSSEVAMAGAAAAADREVLEGYEPWWNSLQEERRKRKKEREEKRKAAAAAKKNQEYRPPEHSTFPSTLFTTTQAPKASGGGREVNIPYLLKMSDKLLSSYEAEVEAGKEGARTEEIIESALAFALHEMTERRGGDNNIGDVKTGALFARKIFGDSDSSGMTKLEFVTEKEKDFLLDLTSRALSRRKERIGQSEAAKFYPAVAYQQQEMQQQQHHYLAHLRQQQQYVPVAIKYMKPQLERIPAPPVPERDKTYPGPEATTSEPAEEFTNFKIFNRKKQPLDVSSLASTAAVVTASRYTTEATTTTATTASPLTYVQKYADHVDEGVKRRPPRASMPTPPNYKVTFDNSRRRRPNKVKGVAFEDLPMKKKKKKGPTRTSAPKLTQKQKFSSVKQAAAEEEEDKGPEMSSLHLGQQEKAPLAGEGDTPGGIGSQLVSPFLAARPVPASTQFHFRRIPHVPSPSSPDKNITNSFLEASPFMETGGSASHMAGGRWDEDGAYLKVKVIESPFLLDLETDKEGSLLETRVSTVPDVISATNPQEEPSLYKPSRVTDVMRDSTNYYPQLAHYLKQAKKKHQQQHQHQHHRQNPYSVHSKPSVGDFHLKLPIQSDLQQSAPVLGNTGGTTQQGTSVTMPTTTTSNIVASSITTPSPPTTRPTMPSQAEINFKKRLQAETPYKDYEVNGNHYHQQQQQQQQQQQHSVFGDDLRHKDVVYHADRYPSLEQGGTRHELHDSRGQQSGASVSPSEVWRPRQQGVPGAAAAQEEESPTFIVQLNKGGGGSTFGSGHKVQVHHMTPPTPPSLSLSSETGSLQGGRVGSLPELSHSEMLTPAFSLPESSSPPRRTAPIPFQDWSWEGEDDFPSPSDFGFNGGEHDTGRDKFDFQPALRPPQQFSFVEGERPTMGLGGDFVLNGRMPDDEEEDEEEEDDSRDTEGRSSSSRNRNRDRNGSTRRRFEGGLLRPPSAVAAIFEDEFDLPKGSMSGVAGRTRISTTGPIELPASLRIYGQAYLDSNRRSGDVEEEEEEDDEDDDESTRTGDGTDFGDIGGVGSFFSANRRTASLPQDTATRRSSSSSSSTSTSPRSSGIPKLSSFMRGGGSSSSSSKRRGESPSSSTQSRTSSSGSGLFSWPFSSSSRKKKKPSPTHRPLFGTKPSSRTKSDQVAKASPVKKKRNPFRPQRPKPSSAKTTAGTSTTSGRWRSSASKKTVSSAAKGASTSISGRKSTSKKSSPEVTELRKQNKLLIELLQGALKVSQKTKKAKKKKAKKKTKSKTRPPSFRAANTHQQAASSKRGNGMLPSGSTSSSTFVPAPSPSRFFPSPPVMDPLSASVAAGDFTILSPQNLPLPKLSAKNTGDGFFTETFRNFKKNRRIFFNF